MLHSHHQDDTDGHQGQPGQDGDEDDEDGGDDEVGLPAGVGHDVLRLGLLESEGVQCGGLADSLRREQIFYFTKFSVWRENKEFHKC